MAAFIFCRSWNRGVFELSCLKENPNVMTTRNHLFSSSIILLVISALTVSCDYSNDPGPLQETQKEFTTVDFDRLEIGDAFNITVQQGDFFGISVRGDRRNIDDLQVTKEGSTLMVRFQNNRNRKHDTYITITMPELVSVNFSGASDSRISGFEDLETLGIYLSGASVSQVDASASNVKVILSGASYLNLRGSGESMQAEATGASIFKAFLFPVTQADINASGASRGSVTVTDQLKATASGASVISYRGSPVVISNVSGASTVRQD